MKKLVIFLMLASLAGCPNMDLDQAEDQLAQAYLILDELELAGVDEEKLEDARQVVERLEGIVNRLRARKDLPKLPEDNDEALKELING